MERQPHDYSSRDVGMDRTAVERSVRNALSEISQAIDQLERTYREGRITPGELAEEKDVLRAQQHAFRARLD